MNVYRERAGVRVNRRVVASGSSAAGRGYSFVDRTLRGNRAVGARYWLQAVNLDGSRSWFGPARVASALVAR